MRAVCHAIKLLLAAAMFLLLVGCAGRVNGAADAHLCTAALEPSYARAVESAAAEWNDRAGTALVVDAEPGCAGGDPARTYLVTETTDLESWEGGRTRYDWHAGEPNKIFLRPGYSDESARRIALHELGQALGLGHSPLRSDVMYGLDGAVNAHLSAHDLKTYWRVSGHSAPASDEGAVLQ